MARPAWVMKGKAFAIGRYRSLRAALSPATSERQTCFAVLPMRTNTLTSGENDYRHQGSATWPATTDSTRKRQRILIFENHSRSLTLGV